MRDPHRNEKSLELRQESLSVPTVGPHRVQPVRDARGLFKWVPEQRETIRFDAPFVPLSRLTRWPTNPATRISSTPVASFVHHWVRTLIGVGVGSANHRIAGSRVACILAKRLDGNLYFLIQGKCEPVNLNSSQLSLTLQST